MSRPAVRMSYAATIDHRLMRPLCLALEAASGRARLEKLYREFLSDPASGDFFAEAISRMNISLAARGTSRIPRTGPLAVVANHPYGAVDGIALGCLLGRVRGDSIETSWQDSEVSGAPSDPLPSDPDWAGRTVFTDSRSVATRASALANR